MSILDDLRDHNDRRLQELASRPSVHELGQWLEDCVDVDPSAWVRSSDLFRSWSAWCAQQTPPVNPSTPNALGRLLSGVQCHSAKRNGARGWIGMRLSLTPAAPRPQTVQLVEPEPEMRPAGFDAWLAEATEADPSYREDARKLWDSWSRREPTTTTKSLLARWLAEAGFRRDGVATWIGLRLKG